jgi:hypothetical protein
VGGCNGWCPGGRKSGGGMVIRGARPNSSCMEEKMREDKTLPETTLEDVKVGWRRD